jgi:hypothetical protein
LARLLFSGSMPLNEITRSEVKSIILNPLLCALWETTWFISEVNTVRQQADMRCSLLGVNLLKCRRGKQWAARALALSYRTRIAQIDSPARARD